MRKPKNTAANAAATEATNVAPATATLIVAATLIGGYTLRNVSKASRDIRAMRTAFGGTVTPRDASYNLSFGDAVTRTGADIVSLAAIASAGSNVHGASFGSVSNKPHDAGASVRSIKAGLTAIDNPSTDIETAYTPEAERSAIDPANANAEIALRLTERGKQLLALLRSKQTPAS